MITLEEILFYTNKINTPLHIGFGLFIAFDGDSNKLTMFYQRVLPNMLGSIQRPIKINYHPPSSEKHLIELLQGYADILSSKENEDFLIVLPDSWVAPEDVKKRVQSCLETLLA